MLLCDVYTPKYRHFLSLPVSTTVVEVLLHRKPAYARHFKFVSSTFQLYFIDKCQIDDHLLLSRLHAV